MIARAFGSVGLLALLVGAPAAAQDRGSVSGTITEAATGRPVSDVRVAVVGSLLQGVTDLRGQYRISGITPGQIVLKARRIGYKATDKPVTITANGNAVLDFSLPISVVQLEDLVVSGTAGDLTRRAQAGSVAEVGVPDLEQSAPINSVAEVLQSRIPGVSVVRASGSSGTSSQIRIRGAASINLSNEPLIYVDGVRVLSGIGVNLVGGQFTDRLQELNPKDIESIEVVKGPAAATLYGADASAGVISIMTKRGKVGSNRFTQNVEFQYNRIEPNFTPPSNFGNCSAALVAPTSTNPLCRGQAVGTLVEDNPLVRTGGFINGNLKSVAWSGNGGGPNFGFFLSGNYDNEDGTNRNNGFDRRSARGNFRWSPTERLSFDATFNLNRANFQLPDNDNNVYGYLGGGLLGTPLTRNDTGNPSNDGWFGFARQIDAISKITNLQQTHRSIGTLAANWNPLPWLTNRFTLGADYTRDEVRRFFPKNSIGSYQGTANTGSVTEVRVGSERYTIDYLGNIKVNTGESIAHNVSFGFQVIDTRIERLDASGLGLTTNSARVVSAASITSGAQQFANKRDVGFLSQWQGAYKNRLFLTLGARLDASSAFGNTSTWFFLPKVGVSYVVSDESFFGKGLGFINTMRVRAAFGTTGRSPGAGAALTTLNPAPYLDGIATFPGAIPLNPGNKDLKAERGTEVEGAVEFGMFNERVGLEVTYFRKNTRDLILQRPLPPSLGFTQNPFVNLGKVLNSGFEFSVNATPVQSKDLSWDVRVGASTLHNELVDLGGVAPFGTINRYTPGYQLGAWFANKIRKVDLAAGTVTVSDTAEFIGNTLPTFEGNFSTNLTIKRNLRLFASLDAKTGHLVRNFTDFFRETQLVRSDNRLNPTKLSAEERLRRYGDERAGHPAFIRENGTSATVNEVQEEYMQKADFLKLREVSVTYTLPRKLANAFGSQGLSLTFAGQNLAKWTSYEGFDPEVVSAANATFNRDDFLTVPPARRFVVKANFTF